MPFPIMPVNDKREGPDIGPKHDFFNLLPLLLNPITVLQDSVLSSKDKETIRDIWLKSETLENGKLKVASNIPERDLMELKGRGLIEGDGRLISFTAKGEKMLRESILNDEQCALQKKASLFKKASRKLVAKNSYDFGDEVLIRTESKESLGTRYIAIPKTAFAAKSKAAPREIEEYKVATRKNDGSYKSLNDYNEDELIQVLHLTKSLISSHKDISKKLAQTGKFESMVSIHRLKSFAIKIMEELNSR